MMNSVRDLARRLRNRTAGRDLSPLAREMLKEGLTYLSPGKLRRIENALAGTRQLNGDLAEFGVALGGSAILIAAHADRRSFHGFDVFGMIPEPASQKDDQKSRQRYQTIRSGQSRGIDGQLYYGYREDLFSQVKASFARHGLPVGQDGIHLHQGLFEDTWDTVEVDRLSFVHVDCDWYDPVAYCLRVVAPKLMAGGTIVIDDYHDYGGCRIAVDEFLAEHPEFAFEDGANPILRKR